MIQAKVVADSINEFGDRITSMLITFPRIILAEAKTHRIVSGLHEEVDISMNSFREGSKNSASSRAIPFERMKKIVRTNPFTPIAWQEEHTGMQGTKYITNKAIIEDNNIAWRGALDNAVFWAEQLTFNHATKQLANRLLEPFMWTTVLVTATEWDNFFELRCPQYWYEPEEKLFKSRKDFAEYWFSNFGSGIEEAIEGDENLWWLALNKGQAEIHMMALAEAMWDARNESEPNKLGAGEWHIPFSSKISGILVDTLIEKDKIFGMGEYVREYIQKHVEISTAMAARTSYTIVGDEKELSYSTLVGIHDKMKDQKPFHASPFEHCAKTMGTSDLDNYLRIEDGKTSVGWCRNFKGFIQYRALLEGATV